PLLLEVLIGLLTAASGVHALLASPAADAARSNAISSPALGFIGAVTGFGSALSGTGGPLILVPILIWLDLPVLSAIALSQAIQLPIAVLATAGNMLSDSLDPTLGGLLAAGLAIGTFVGAKVAHAVPRRALRGAVAIVLIVVGASIALNVVARLV
ncbi:MAG: sulfite exporter TauE/SafE family protein, partial [Xanthobacteraceae bacterium]